MWLPVFLAQYPLPSAPPVAWMVPVSPPPPGWGPSTRRHQYWSGLPPTGLGDTGNQPGGGGDTASITGQRRRVSLGWYWSPPPPSSPPLPPCLDNGMGGTTGRGDWPPLPLDPETVQCTDPATFWLGWRLCHSSGKNPTRGPDSDIYDNCTKLYANNVCYPPGDYDSEFGCIKDAIDYCKSQYVL